MNDFTEKQRKCLTFFKNNLALFLADSSLINRHVVIADEKIQGSFDTLDAALVYAIDNFRKGDYIIQQIINEAGIINFVKAAIV